MRPGARTRGTPDEVARSVETQVVEVANKVGDSMHVGEEMQHWWFDCVRPVLIPGQAIAIFVAVAACNAESVGPSLPLCQSESGSLCRGSVLEEFSQVKVSDIPKLIVTSRIASSVAEGFQTFTINNGDNPIWAWSRRTVGGVISVDEDTAFQIAYSTRGLADHELSIALGTRLLYWAVEATETPADGVWRWGAGDVAVAIEEHVDPACIEAGVPPADIRGHQFRFRMGGSEVVVADGGIGHLGDMVLSTARVRSPSSPGPVDDARYLFEILVFAWK